MRVVVIAVLLLVLALPALGQPIPNAKSQGVTIDNTKSWQILPANDLGLGARDYILIQCTGAVACFCCIGTNNNCTTLNGTQLAAGTGAWILTSVNRSNGIIIPAPVGDIACTTAAGSSQVSTLDY